MQEIPGFVLQSIMKIKKYILNCLELQPILLW